MIFLDDEDINQNPEDTKPIEPELPEPPAVEQEEPEMFFEWEYKNIPDFYNRVRGALNVESTLSDTTIDYFENAPMAEIKIKQLVPKWKELNEYKRLLFETCIIYMTCYILCPSFSSNKMTKYKDTSLEVNYAVNINDKPCARFMELIEDLIAQINEKEKAPFFTGFMVTPSAPSSCGCRILRFPHIIPPKPVEDVSPEEPIVPELPETSDSPDENTPLGSE